MFRFFDLTQYRKFRIDSMALTLLEIEFHILVKGYYLAQNAINILVLNLSM